MTKKILLILTAIILLCIALYYYGFIYAFRNFSGSESWRPLSEYQLYAKKEIVEQTIYALEKKNSSILIEHSGMKSPSDDFTIFIIDALPDTITYNFRIPGNDSTWNSSLTSKILLMRISNRRFTITYPTLKKTDKKEFKKLLTLFESNVIDSLKSVRNPD